MRTASLCLTLLLLLGTVPLAAEQLPAGQVGRVIALQGQARAVNGGQVRPLALRATVGLNDEIATDATGRIQVMFIDHTVFSLAPNSRLRVREYRFDREAIARFEMGQGSFRMVSGRIVERNPQGFTMQSPAATIGIRGTMTAHTIGENGEQHYALDLEGGHQVEITGQNGMQTLTFDGAALDVGADGTLGGVRTASGDELQELEQSTGFAADGDAGDDAGTGDGSPDGGDGSGNGEGTSAGDGTGEDNDGTSGGGELFAGTDPEAGDLGADFTAESTGEELGSFIDEPAGTATKEPFTNAYYAAGVNIYLGTSPGPGFIPGAYYLTPTGRTIATDNLTPSVHLGGNAANPDISFAGTTEGDVGAVANVAYDDGGYTLAWSGAVYGTYTSEGEYTCPVTGDVHMEWGYWELADPAYVFALTGNRPLDAQLTPVYQVLGVQTPTADLDALRTNSYVGSYSGSACGMYYEQVGAGIPLSGSFSCNIDFSGNSVYGAVLDFPSEGVSLLNGSGALTGSGEFQLSFPNGTFPAGAASGDAVGSVFGPQAGYVGGTWAGSAAGAHAVGSFTGASTGGGI